MNTSLSYPLDLHFKFFALSPQIILKNSSGEEVLFIHQKLLKLREDVRVYSDSSKSIELFRINADQIIDFSAKYYFTNNQTQEIIGSMGRKGWISFWQATFECLDAQKQTTHVILETNPWIKVLNGLVESIPFIGFLISGFFLHPSYTVFSGKSRESHQQAVLKITKKASFFEQKFQIDKLDLTLDETTETRLILSLLMMVQLERSRG